MQIKPNCRQISTKMKKMILFTILAGFPPNIATLAESTIISHLLG